MDKITGGNLKRKAQPIGPEVNMDKIKAMESRSRTRCKQKWNIENDSMVVMQT